MAQARRILVPVDFSEPSRAALDYAAELARMLGASIDVLHIWEAPAFVAPGSLAEHPFDSVPLLELVRKNAETGLERFVSEASKRGIVIQSARAELGSPVHAIVAAAKAGKYDLLVLGTHGRTGVSHALIGSVAERVVRHTSCPVLSVRTRTAA